MYNNEMNFEVKILSIDFIISVEECRNVLLSNKRLCNFLFVYFNSIYKNI